MKLLFTAILFLAISPYTNIFSQESKVSYVEDNNFDMAEDSDKKDLALTKKEIKEFDNFGRLVNYELHLSNPANDLILRSKNTTFFKEDTRIEHKLRYDEMGDMVSDYKTFFSTSENRKIKLEFSEINKNNNEKFIKSYSYNKIGKPSKITTNNNSNKKVGEETFKYNKLQEETMYKKWELNSDNSKTQLIKKTAYTKEGFLASSETIKKENGDIYKDIITFERNRIIDHLKYKNGEQLSSFGGANASYDPSKSKVIIDFQQRKKGKSGLWHNEEEYNQNGNKTKTIQMIDDEIVEVIEYKYDSAENLLETIHQSYEDGKVTDIVKEKLEYDENNSILSKSVYKNGELINKHTFKYKYH